ncbi:MAG TPA: hypothetical protein VFJ14_06860 [Nocardioidaceae bacterium]|nr:hypothetical protein [Nocardioidaceae bacterium]
MPQPIQAHAHAARYRLPDEQGPPATFTGEDTRHGLQYLLEVWPDGTRTIATRQWSWSTWSAPVTLHAVSKAAS